MSNPYASSNLSPESEKLWAVAIHLLPIVWIVFRLIAAFKAGQGEFYKIPIAIKFIKL